MSQELPIAGTVVLAVVQHFHTMGKRFYELVRVEEDDCSWRTADDNSELAHEWNVIAWVPKIEAMADFGRRPAPAESLNEARAEAMMDASWLIWETVVCTSPQLKTVRRCREEIEAAAQRLFPGAKAYHSREGATRP